MADGIAVESMPGEGAGRMAQQRRLVWLVVAVIGVVGASYTQKSSLSLRTAPTFVASLLALLIGGEITVRILDRRSHRKGQTDGCGPDDERVGELLDGLSWGGVALHHISTGHKPIEHLVFRPEGLVFLIQTQPEAGRVAEEGGELRLNGRPLPKSLLKEVRGKLDWLRDSLRAQLGCDPRLEAGLVFTNADVAACYRFEGVALLGLEHLQPWLDTAEPNDEFGKRLWPQMAQVRTQLMKPADHRSLGPIVVPAGVVLLLGIVWLAVSAPSAAKQPVSPVTAVEPAQPAQEPAAPITEPAKPTSAPAWVKDIYLEGVSGAPPRRLAIINRKTIAVGESAAIKVAGRNVLIRCVDIQGESAAINLEGVVGVLDLRLRDEGKAKSNH